MKIIINTVWAVFLLGFITIVGVNLILINEKISTARAFYSSTIEYIENSNFDEKVITSCSQKAEAYGYKMKVQDLSYAYEDEEIPCYYVSIEYKITIPLLNITEDATIKGYAE